jgi:RNA polymerase sigma factor (sigma-70 family)
MACGVRLRRGPRIRADLARDADALAIARPPPLPGEPSRGAPDELQVRRIAVDADAGVAVDRARVQAALANLPPEQRVVVELGFCSGLSSTEIAARESIPVGTVKSRTAAALGKLRVELLGGSK